jgi:hypothetical protein
LLSVVPDGTPVVAAEGKLRPRTTVPPAAGGVVVVVVVGEVDVALLVGFVVVGLAEVGVTEVAVDGALPTV